MLIRKRNKMLLPLFIILIFLLLALTVGATVTSRNWYVQRNREHKQPTPDKSFASMENGNVFYVDKKHGDQCKEKVIYLTFDAGYENGNVAKIVEILHEENVPAAFFVLPYFIEKNEELCKKMLEQGILLCNHSARHKDMSLMTEEEFKEDLGRVEKVCLEVTGSKIAPFFRPPEGRYSQSCLKYAEEMGYKTVFWSFAYADWDDQRQPNEEAAVRKIMENTHNGEIILLHPTSTTNAKILRTLINEWRNEGYRFAALTELE